MSLRLKKIALDRSSVDAFVYIYIPGNVVNKRYDWAI